MPPLKIVFNNEDFLIITKPAGISFHSEQGEPGLFARLQQELHKEHLYPVHRLDKITSGLLIVAKNKESATLFSQLFADKGIEKYYLAISDKNPKKKQGLISGDMIPSRRGAWKLLKTRESPAITQFHSTSIKTGKRLYLLKPHTGKTHQIRVALKSISAPVLGDPLYNKKSTKDHERAYLHAYYLRFMWKNELFEFRDIPTVGELFLGKTFIDCIESIYKSPSSLPWPSLGKISLTET